MYEENLKKVSQRIFKSFSLLVTHFSLK